MSRAACLTACVALGLFASCFVAPATPGASHEASNSIDEKRFSSAPAPDAEQPSWNAFSPVALGVALGLAMAVLGARPAMAVDLDNGADVFAGNCAACHAGGNNTVVSEKKLKKEALITYGKYEAYLLK